MTACSAAADRSAHRGPRLRRVGPTIAAIWLAFGGGTGLATGTSALSIDTHLFLDRQALSLPGDVEITVGEPDPRLNLAPCLRYEPFIPAGARLWGRTTLGVRCVEGATWSVFLPVQIKVFAPAPVAARSIARGQAIGPDDVRFERVELTRWPAGALAAADQLDGKLAARAIVAGEPLHRDLLRTAPLIVPGDPVKIVFSRGEEFVASPPRQPTISTVEQGCDGAGRLTFRKVDMILDNGAYTSWGATTPFVMMQTISSFACAGSQPIARDARIGPKLRRPTGG